MNTINKESIFIKRNEYYPVQQSFLITSDNGYANMTVPTSETQEYTHSNSFTLGTKDHCDHIKICPSSKAGCPYIIKLSYKKITNEYLSLKASSETEISHNHPPHDKCLESTLKGRFSRVTSEDAKQISMPVDTNTKTREIQRSITDETDDNNKLYISDINNIKAAFAQISVPVMEGARCFFEVMAVDVVYFTNKLEILLVRVEGIHNLGGEALKPFPAAFAWVSNEHQDTCIRFIQQLKPLVFEDKTLSTVFVEKKCTALINALDIVFSDNNKLIFYWHMLNSVMKVFSVKVVKSRESLTWLLTSMAKPAENNLEETIRVDEKSEVWIKEIIKLGSLFCSCGGSQQVANPLSKIKTVTFEFEDRIVHPSISF
ncbi:hypothetical protein PHYBLDRAFT_144877 [Phycomyces blakesleeanus NRRL 1555(-)]|uniref:MULE transposase domain-containing protein n=1 Tax=Phycomyces blakesleeanus (strain ATCC 8743b / DSM 1359 / FGSC 10004 / NBRC 33097 / NRRL 1555) TaxID=763407 RepID=A0A162UE11_PHYB8|nr:hypothetical protein PHYBLDRAFT_144877 [Phycomyces blakesleeanus NRRL 1555(-)]OAD74423.1 hypothetical protein PHYBLDRAFT_144877 [Phycomyces blakesleeanus NRRL 1555(-)]|eukprot:XP_018292463.1 hypothetical protein PHYBLDRAFT_144877 [Phycomyces blakesleeanus NRRL 1555(-)]